MGKGPMAKITLDDETTAALTLFNEYVAADRERTQREQRLKKAKRAKDDAAALVKKLPAGGSSTERSEAEAAYLAAAEKWKALRDGKEPPADHSASSEAQADATTDPDDVAEAEESPGQEKKADAEAGTEPNEASEGVRPAE